MMIRGIGLLALLAHLAFSSCLLAHNGAVAIAVPVEGITIDGDLSDWPEGTERYPIRHNVSGDAPEDIADFRGEFAVSYSEDENALYVAVEIEDDWLVKSPAEDMREATQESCTIYLATRHAGEDVGSHEFWMRGERLGPPPLVESGAVRAAVRWGENAYSYEWRIDASSLGDGQVQLRSGVALGFDVTHWDRDQKVASMMAWGRGRYKLYFPVMMGDLILCEYDVALESSAPLIESMMEVATMRNRSTIRRETAYQMSFTVVALTFAVLHLFLFLFYPRSRENLYFAVWMGALAIHTYLDFQQIWSPEIGWKFAGPLRSLLMPGLLGVMYSLFYARVPWQFWIFLLGGLGIAVGGRLDSEVLGGFVPNLWNAAQVLEVLRVILAAMVRRREGARILGLGIAAAMLFFGFLLLERLGITAPTEGGAYRVYWGICCAMLSVSVHLARRFAGTSRDLETQLIQVRRLSQQALEQERQIRQQEVEQRVLEEELQTAHEMQMGLMPTGSPEIPGLRIAGRCVSATHVGGDFFQYFEQDGSIAVSLADVTGHAMEAAIPAVMFGGVLDKQMEIPTTLEARFVGLNRSLCRSLGDHTFICLSMAEVDPTTQVMRISNCGCPYPLHYRTGTGEIEEIQVVAYALGIRPDTEYAAIDVVLEQGDYVVLHSDGFSEAARADGEQFGFDRAMEVMGQGCSEGLSPEELIDRLIGEVRAFAGDEPQADDMTCVVIRVEI